MQSSKLYSILQNFDKYEQGRCRKFLQSPYFNVNQTLVDLYDLLIEDVNGKRKNKSLDKELIWKDLKLNGAYDDVRFRKYCSDLLKMLERYMSQEIYENTPLQQATYLIEAVGQKKMEKLYNTAMKTARMQSEQQPFRHSEYYFFQYDIEKKYYEMAQQELKRSEKSNVEKIANNLDIFYLSEKLRLFSSVINQQAFISHEYQLLFVDEIVSHIKKMNYDEVPPIALYYQVYLTSTESSNLQHYYKLKELLEKYGLAFPQSEALQLYYSAINYSIEKINSGDQSFLNELFDLYNDLINKKIIFVNNELSPWSFKNITVLALRLKKYAWTEDFILRYNEKLPPAFRGNAVTYNMAQLYFYQKKYDQVIEQLRNVEYEDMTYNLSSKAMLLATYYELDEVEPLYSLIDSFSAYLNRHKDIASDKRKDFSNLIKFTKKLLKVNPSDKKALEVLKQEVQATKRLASPNWLLEKIAELE